MECEFEYCIYNRSFNCILSERNINSLGMCDACIVVSFDRKFLAKEKEKQFLKLEEQWTESNKKSL